MSEFSIYYHIDLKKYKLKKYVFLIVSTIVALANMLFCTSYYLSLILVTIETLILFYLFIKKHYTDYLCYYLIFMCLSLEFPYYYELGELYGFKSLRIGGVSIGSLLLLPLFFVATIKFKPLLSKFKGNKILNKFIFLLIVMVATGILMGILQIITNDNEVKRINGIWIEFFKELYAFLMLVLIPAITYYFITVKYKCEFYKIVRCLYSIMGGLIVAQLVSANTSLKGSLWGDSSLLVSSLSFYTPYFILFYFYRNRTNRILSFILGLSGCLMSSVFATTSGGFIILISIPVIIFLILWKEKRMSELTICLFAFLAIIIVAIIYIKNNVQLSNLVIYKAKQAISLFRFWEDGWYSNIPPSAKFRLEEFYNIMREYNEKPWFLLFGKGIMGTCLDYSGHFKEMYSIGGAFTDPEWINDTYYSVHESINVLFLSNGLFGLYTIYFVVKTVIRYICKSPFIIIGLAWFLFHYTYSFTLSMFGLMCIMVGFHEIDLIKNGEKYEIP